MGMLHLKHDNPETFERYVTQLQERINGGTPPLKKFREWPTADLQRLLRTLEEVERLSRISGTRESARGAPTHTSETIHAAESVGLEEIVKKADYLRQRKAINPREFRLSIQEIQEMAEGGNPQNIRQFYKGWTNENFTRLLEELADEID